MGYLNLVGSFVYKQPLFRAKLAALSGNDAQLYVDAWAQNSKTIFFQASVPSGWTQDVTQNDKALRVVGPVVGGGSGGSRAISSGISLAHSHSIDSQDSHTHVFADHTHRFGTGALSSQHNAVAQFSCSGPYFTGWGAGGSFSVDIAAAVMVTLGAITLGTQAAHNHGAATDSQLADYTPYYCDTIIGTKNATAGSYTDLTTYWHTGDLITFDPFQTFANNDAYNYGTLMPGGTVAIFVQPTPPSAWTRVVDKNDRMLRVVNGTGGGVGGSMVFSLPVTLAHVHNVTAATDHTHSIPAHTHLINQVAFSINYGAPLTSGSGYILDDGAGHLVISDSAYSPASRAGYETQSTNSGAGSTSAAGGHTHGVTSAVADFRFAYVDVIECSKDAGGTSPDAYTDMTAVFAWKKLVTRQRLNSLAANDSFIHYHTTPSGTNMLFFMASPPSAWTQNTSQHDKALRIVSGATGGLAGGGSQLLSIPISLAHVHPINSAGNHVHAVNHTHPLATGTVTANAPTSTRVQSRGSAGSMAAGASGGGLTGAEDLGTVSQNPPEVPVSHPDHTHTAGSSLSDIGFAYCDVIWCSKN